MAVIAAGVYLAFDGGPDSSGASGTGIGPYEEIVLRGARAVGERAGLGKVIALRSAAGSWRDAESSSSGSDHVDGRSDLRITGGNGSVVLRFADDEIASHPAIPDLGPFAAVMVGTYDVRGDGQTLAVRLSRVSPWQLTDRAGAGHQGATTEALVFAATDRTGLPSSRPAAATLSRPSPVAAAPLRAAPAAEEAEPSVWVDRVKSAPDIYISRPDPKR